MADVELEYEEPAYDEPAIDRPARRLDREPMSERARIGRRSRRRIAVLVAGFLLALVASIAVFSGAASTPGALGGALVPSVILAGFVFETLDSASGMGFGTSLSPLLFALGYAPLEVVPVLFVTETVTGLLAGSVHHEFENVRFGRTRPLNEATRAVLLLSVAGVVGTLVAIAFAYLLVALPAALIEAYVAVLVIGMGLLGLARQFLPRSAVYRPRRLIGFALLAGCNKGISGGGFGPVVTLGQIFAGVYEKTATAITTLAEGLVSLVGAAAYFALFAAGLPVEYALLPSLLTGAFFAAIVAPYIVRVLPGRVLGYLIPVYAFAIGAVALTEALG
jgi:uncharacterized membrane protein YfcA